MLTLDTRCAEPRTGTVRERFLFHAIVGPQNLSLDIGTDISGAAIAAVACCGAEYHSRISETQTTWAEEATKAYSKVLKTGEDTGAELSHLCMMSLLL